VLQQDNTCVLKGAMELQTFDPEGDLILILIQHPEEEDIHPDGDNEDAVGSSDEISPILTDDFASSNTLVQYPICNPSQSLRRKYVCWSLQDT
jgi:hypothetical protein